MNILMVTNTYPPHVGGVAVSVKSYVERLIKEGHNVVVLAPEFEGTPKDEENVVRVPAIQNFNGSDFSVRLPIPTFLSSKLNQFRPDLVHSHHPFLLGDTGLRIASKFDVPIIFTYHTMYERYTHYVPGDSPALKRFVVRLSAGYANLCQQVIAPSESIKNILKERGVETPITVIPTGIDQQRFSQGSRDKLRSELHIPKSAKIIGHVGRLAEEKNLIFLAKSVSAFLKDDRSAHLIIVGEGSSEAELKRIFSAASQRERVHFTGTLIDRDLVDALHAMDLFVFASITETQGLVIAEAMAAGLPVIALDGPGVREVVKDGQNGTLLPHQSIPRFKRAISNYFSTTRRVQDEFSRNAVKTASDFSMDRTYSLLIETYQATARDKFISQTYQDSPWEKALSLAETEWALIKNRLNSTNLPNWLLKGYRLFPFDQWFSRLKRITDVNQLAIRFLKLDGKASQPRQRGLVLIQIDGLSRPQLELGLCRNKLKFISNLINKQKYELHTFYSGLPSTTPAVQAELFYNIRTAVPAFSYYSRRLKRNMIMYNATCVSTIEQELGVKNEGLLKGGSSYSNIYTGQAEEAHFSPAALGWQHFQRWFSARPLIYFLLWQFFTIPRVVVLGLVEVFLAIADFLSGIDRGYNFIKELRFIPNRLAVTVILRELVSAGVILDIARGMPIIHLNLLGYDEQSHRRGPTSRFAHWTLKGIDRTVRRICLATQRSPHRHYQVWIYSDHGQEQTTHFEKSAGISLEEAVRKSLSISSPLPRDAESLIGHQLSRSFYLKCFSKLVSAQDTAGTDLNTVRIKALGPVGHIYLPETCRFERQKEVAERLVQHGVPSVLFRKEKEIFWCDNNGIQDYKDYAPQVFDSELPYYSNLIEDLENLVRHPDAGDFVILGYHKGEQPLITFVIENGSHAGPGPNETHGFLLMPTGSRYLSQEKAFFRPSDLREKVQHFLKQKKSSAHSPKVGTVKKEQDLRIMTYNIRSARGSDNLFCLERVSDVISRYHPDVVCLQEVDVTRRRSAGLDQAKYLAESLQMEYYFNATLEMDGELYGNAILTNLPFSLTKSSKLPALPGKPYLEPRGCIWLTIDMGKHKLQVINVHLSLNRLEREIQVNELLGARWLQSPLSSNDHIIFCGDFNMTTKSYVYKQIVKELIDSNNSNTIKWPKSTWPSFLPIVRLDYIFTSRSIDTKRAFVARDVTAVAASDHLPLIADLQLSLSTRP